MTLTRATMLQGVPPRRRRVFAGMTADERGGGVYRGSGTETIIMMLPGARSQRERHPPIVYCHGGGGVAADIYRYPLVSVAGAFLQAGYPVISADLGGGFTWGNDDSQDAIGDAIAYSGTTWGTRTDRVALWVDSHGGSVGLPWAAHNPSKVAWIYAQVPIVSFVPFRAYPPNEALWGAGIDTAYGGNAAYLAALPTHDPGAPAQTNALRAFGPRLRIDADLEDIYARHDMYDQFMTEVDEADFRWWPGIHFHARLHDPHQLTRWAWSMTDTYG